MSRKSLVPIVLPADPVASLEAATKQYVDGRLALSGGALTGPVTSSSTVLLDAAGVALRIRRGDGTEAFLVDNTGGNVLVRNAIDLVMARDNTASIPVFRVDGQNGSLHGGGTAPTIAPLVALGVGGTATVQWGNDTWIAISLTAGSSGMSATVVATVTLPNARPNTSYNVNVQPTSAVSTDNGKTYCSNLTTTSFQINLRWTPTSGQTFNYLLEVIGMGA